MTPMLRAEGLSYTFESGFVAGPLDLRMGAGLLHLMGPNGSGKTTLLRCLCGGLRRSRGTVAVCGLDPRIDPAARRHVAMLSADAELPAFLTVDEAWQDLAAIRGVPDWNGASLRDQLDLPGGLPLAHASTGQRRLAELLAACAGDPAVLLLDEPFTNLAPSGVQALCTLFESWRPSRAMIVTSHLPLPLPADQVCVVGGAGGPSTGPGLQG